MCVSPTLPRHTLHTEYFLPVQLDIFKPLQTEQSHFICASYHDQWQVVHLLIFLLYSHHYVARQINCLVLICLKDYTRRLRGKWHVFSA